jgi:hypothetical protein
LAELSLVQLAPSSPNLVRFPARESRTKWKALVKEYWPGALATFSLFLASSPPENAQLAAYSRFLGLFFNKYITTRGGKAPYLKCLMVGENEQTIAAFGGIGLILSILYSPFLRRFLSQPAFVFLGSISFPLYLLHGTFIRLLLAWLLLKFLPGFSIDVVQQMMGWEGKDVFVLQCDLSFCKLAVSVAYLFWLALLLGFCRLWKEHVDVLGVQLSRWAEEIVLGKREVDIRTGPFFGGVWEKWLDYFRSMEVDTEKIQ